jgi:hypothetical protein
MHSHPNLSFVVSLAAVCIVAACGKDSVQPKKGLDTGAAVDSGPADSGHRDASGAPDSGSDAPLDTGSDASDVASDSAVDLGADAADIADMDEGPPLRDGWFATQTVAQRPYSGQSATTRWHTTTLAVSFFPQPASADEICGATLTGYAIKIESAGPRWAPSAMDIEVVDGGTLLQRDFTQTSPGLWVVEFADNPIAIEDTPIGQRVLDVNMTRPTDYDGTSIVTIVARLEEIQGCEGETPRLRAAASPSWSGATLFGDALLVRPTLLTPFDVTESPTEITVLGIQPATLGWYATGTSQNPRCGEVSELWATMDRRRGSWKPTSMMVDVQDTMGQSVGTAQFEEVAADEWRAQFDPPLDVQSDSDFQLHVSSEEVGTRDRFMFRHFWIDTVAPVAPCN